MRRNRALAAAKKLFSTKGYEKTTINRIAALAGISAPTVFSLFKSKEGILKELMNAIVFGPQYLLLVEKAKSLSDPIETLKMAAHITRTIYDAEKLEMGFIRGASVISPELKKLEMAGEQQRYERQEFILHRLDGQGLLSKGLSIVKARDILWGLTSRELYRKLVIERQWPSDEYEDWLRETILQSLAGSAGNR